MVLVGLETVCLGVFRTSYHSPIPGGDPRKSVTAPLMRTIHSILLDESFLKKIFFIYFIFGCGGSSLLFLVAVSRGCSKFAMHRVSHCETHHSLLLQSIDSRCTGFSSCGPCCSVAYGIFPDQKWKLCPLHWQADSHPLYHQGSPVYLF